MLDAQEEAEQLHRWNGLAVEPSPAATLPEMFAAQVRATPDAVAIVDCSAEDGELGRFAREASYAEEQNTRSQPAFD